MQAFKRKDPQLSPRIEKILDDCLQYDIEVEYIASELNVVADSLSRLTTNAIINPIPKIDYEKIGKAQEEDEQLQEFIKNPGKTKLKLIKRTLTTNQDLYGDNATGHFRTYVPKKMTMMVWKYVHDWTHSGIRRTINSIKRDFVWPMMEKDIKLYTRTCMPCQKNKISKKAELPTQNYTCPRGRMATLNIDLISMRKSEQYNHCLTIIDRETCFFHVIPQRTTNTPETVKNLIAHQISVFGVPNVIISDRGSTFTSRKFKDAMTALSIEHRTTCAYRPQSNGKIERVHRDIKRAIRSVGQADNWSKGIYLLTLALRSTINLDDGYTPCEKLYGQVPRLPGILIAPEEYGPFQTEDAAQLKEFLDTEKKRIERKRKEKHYVPKGLKEAALVFLKNEKRKDKFTEPYTGPYLVLEKNENHFKILINRTASSVAISRLKPLSDLPMQIEQMYQPDDQEVASHPLLQGIEGREQTK